MRGEINIPYLSALGNQALLPQQHRDPVSKVTRELRPPSLPASVEVPEFSFGQPSAGLINRMGNMSHQIHFLLWRSPRLGRQLNRESSEPVLSLCQTLIG